MSLGLINNCGKCVELMSHLSWRDPDKTNSRVRTVMT
jgi:hypothetical protein